MKIKNLSISDKDDKKNIEDEYHERRGGSGEDENDIEMNCQVPLTTLS